MSRPFSIGYAYSQTQHYRDAVAAQRAEIADPFEVEVAPEPEAPVAISAPAARVVSIVGPTDAMVRYAVSMMSELLNGATDEVREAAEVRVRAMPKREVHTLIDTLKGQVDAKRAETAKARVARPAPAAQVEEGMYREPGTGDIYKVQIAHHGSGKPYAKRLVRLDEVRTKGKKTYSHDFEYVAGAINRIRTEWRMTKDEAIEWGQLYGACCRCGTILTDEKSIEAGIGPICSGKI